MCGVYCMWFRLTWDYGSGFDPGVMVPVTDPGLGRYKDGIRAVGLGCSYSLAIPLLGVGL